MLFGGALYVLKVYVSYHKHKKAKIEIANLEAKIITLKMALRVKIKIKINSFRSEFSKIIDQQKEIGECILELSKIQYDSSEDFQRHFDLSRKINTLINTHRRLNSKLDSQVAQDVEAEADNTFPTVKLLEEFMGPDYKNEISVIRIIKEITDARLKLIQKINDYNEDYKSDKKQKQLAVVKPLEFTALADINRIFEDSDVILNEMPKRLERQQQALLKSLVA